MREIHAPLYVTPRIGFPIGQIPAIAPAAMAHYLVHCPNGEICIKAMIKDDIHEALARGDKVHALTLKLVMRHFIAEHPRCEERMRKHLHVPERRQKGLEGIR